MKYKLKFILLAALFLLLSPTNAMANFSVIVASSDAPNYQKAAADYVCTGHNDEIVIQKAIEYVSANNGSRVLLSSGNFYIDSFPFTDEENTLTALVIPNGKHQEIIIEGDACPYSTNAKNGTIIRVREKTYEELSDSINIRLSDQDAKKAGTVIFPSLQ